MELSLNEACQYLKEGKTLLYPSDTVWGIGCDATNETAVAKVFEIKKRSLLQPLIILVSHDNMMERFVKEVPEMAWDIIDTTTTPVTIIYPQARNLPSGLLGTDGSIGIRIVRDGLCHQLIYRFNRPVVSTSANISGSPTPLSFNEIDDAVISQVDGIFGKESEPVIGTPSSIIKLEMNGEVRIIRP